MRGVSLAGPGVLVWLEDGIRRKYKLREDEIFIGRKDEDISSDDRCDDGVIEISVLAWNLLKDILRD